MNSIKEIVDNPPRSNYTGSVTTRESVKKQIEERWGKEEAERYNPRENCFTFAKWASMGARILPWQKSLKSTTFVEVVGADGKKKTYKKTCNLFFDLQVRKKLSFNIND